jgi:RND family efflux transporter MFP subunit
VVEVEKEEGDRVREGDILARLDDERYRLEYDKASAEALRTRAIFERNQEGYREDARVKIVSELELEVSRAEYLKAKADSALKHREWGHTEIKAPFTGYVVERKIQPGQWIGMQEELFTVADLDVLWAVFVVPDALQRSLTEGQSITLNVNPEEESFAVRGTLLLRSPVVDPSGGVKITVQILNRPGRFVLPPGFGTRLRPGMPVELVLR